MNYDYPESIGAQIEKTASIDSKYHRPSVKESLQKQKQELEFRLNNVNNALTAIEANPGVEEVLTLLGRV